MNKLKHLEKYPCNIQKPSPRSGCLLEFINHELIVYGGLTGDQEPTRDTIYMLNLKNLEWSKIQLMNSGDQFAYFGYEKLNHKEVLIFGGENFHKYYYYMRGSLILIGQFIEMI